MKSVILAVLVSMFALPVFAVTPVDVLPQVATRGFIEINGSELTIKAAWSMYTGQGEVMQASELTAKITPIIRVFLNNTSETNILELDVAGVMFIDRYYEEKDGTLAWHTLQVWDLSKDASGDVWYDACVGQVEFEQDSKWPYLPKFSVTCCLNDWWEISGPAQTEAVVPGMRLSTTSFGLITDSTKIKGGGNRHTVRSLQNSTCAVFARMVKDRLGNHVITEIEFEQL